MDKNHLGQTLESLREKVSWLTKGFLVAVEYSYVERKSTHPILIPFGGSKLGDLKELYDTALDDFSLLQLLVDCKTPVILRFRSKEKDELIVKSISGYPICIELVIDSNPIDSAKLAKALAEDLVKKEIVKKENHDASLVEKIDKNLQVTVLHGWPHERNEIMILPIYYTNSPKPVIGVVSLNLLSEPSSVTPGQIYADIIDFIIPCVGRHFVGPHIKELETLAQNRALKAARAAVFARNFSHITGSHVISNPEFRNSLAGHHFVHGLRRKLDETYSNFLRAESGLIKYISQGPDRAEDLWAEGTKALADARDKLGTGDVFQENTRIFHEYLQGRFDFIARAIDDTQDTSEPVWFVRDLLEGFLSQTAYLDNLVADIGLRLDNMEFYFKIEDQEFRARWIRSQSAGKGETDLLPADFPLEIEWDKVISLNYNVANTRLQSIYELDKMIALPGGMVAAHAFYSLLENIIRNSAKYGDLKRCTMNSKYQLTVELTPQIEITAQSQLLQTVKSSISYYRLRIWDNYSSAILIDEKCVPLAIDADAHNQPWRYLQTKLEKKFVKDNGQPESDDLGMMEMQACSQLLCSPDSDGNYLRANEKYHGETICTEFNLSVLPPDLSYGDDKFTFLTFELNVAMPILLGCLTGKQPGHVPTSFYTDDAQKLIDKAPFLMVIDGDWLETNADFNLLSRNDLPNRTLILCSTQIPGIPNVRRVRTCINNELHSLAFVNKKNDENELLLCLYRTWIKEWKKPLDRQEKWHLWIGLERQAQQVQEAWGKQANECFKFDSDPLVELMVKSYSAGQSEPFETDSIHQIYESAAKNQLNNTKLPSSDYAMLTQKDPMKDYWQAELGKKIISHKNTLVFDNHGNCFRQAYQSEKATSHYASTRFYQKLSGSVSPDLFRMLSRPPQDEFSFRFFIYSLVEACLTNVVVVDERLAWSLVEGYGINESNHNFAEDLVEHQKAGIYPIFRFRQHNQCSDRTGFYNEKHLYSLQNCIGADSRLGEPKNPLNQEGIIFDAEKLQNSSLHILTSKPSNNAEASPIQFEVIKTGGSSPETMSEDSLDVDVILIHEGAMDLLTDQKMGVKWVGVEEDKEHEKQLDALYHLAPIIIRTSGRGRKSKLLGEHLPFIEFGQVSSSLLTARNKFALVRGLLGSVGSERIPGNP
jgi:hypothetical protein